MKSYFYGGQSRDLYYFVNKLDHYRKKTNISGDRLYKTFSLITDSNGKKILDVGCNTGYIPLLLYEKGFEVIGIDLFKEQIEIANDVKEHLNIHSDKLSFTQMDFLNNNFPDNYFDYALLLEVIEHVTNPWEFLEQFYRVLKPGGYLILSTPNVLNTYQISKQFYPNLRKLFKDIDDEPKDTGTHLDHIYAWDIFSFYRLINRCGFKYIKHEFAVFDIPFLSSLRIHLPVLNRLSRTMIFKIQKPNKV